MKSPILYRSLDGIDAGGRAVHLAIGMFDGVHLGHQSVIEAAVHSARRDAGIAGVLTFWPHPSALFRPEDPTRQIMDSRNKSRLFCGLGVDIVIEQPFDPAFASIPAVDFIPYLVSRLPTLNSIYVGENWRFGKGRKGDIGLLLQEARQHAVSVISMPRLYLNGEPISSSRIRECLMRGDIEQVNSLLGYRYFIEGEVREGKRLGRTLGFPTLNLPWAGDLEPRHGVYGVRVTGADDSTLGIPGESAPSASWHNGVANFGIRPTVKEKGGGRPLLEVHLLDGECPFGSRDRLFVEFVRFFRSEARFESFDALKEQIRRDCSEARRFFQKDR